MSEPPDPSPPLVSVIVPALNEADNLAPLAERLDAALRGVPYELLVVDDDSADATPQVCAALAERFPLRLLVRTRPKNGLSGAVLHGIAASRGRTIVVMDADLQHPPERVPALLDTLDAGADFVIGSRYMPGGSTEAEWGLLRKLNSKAATLLARPFAGRTTDPMAGFFALRRDTYARATNLTPLGYKIALELMCKTKAADVREIPIRFATRTKGESKLTLKQQFRYLEHLSRLYDFTFPRASPIAKFAVATLASGLAAAIVYVLLRKAAFGAAAAVTLAYAVAVAVTAAFHLRYVRTQREFLVRRRPWLDFAVIAAAEWAACAAAAAWLARRTVGTSVAEAFLIPFGAALVVRYVLRKELLQDIRGLRRTPRSEEVVP